MSKRGPFNTAQPGTDKIRVSDKNQPDLGAAIALPTPARLGVRVGVIIKGREYSVVLSSGGASAFAREVANMARTVEDANRLAPGELLCAEESAES